MAIRAHAVATQLSPFFQMGETKQSKNDLLPKWRMKNSKQNYITAQDALYLGFIQDPVSSERSAVLKLPQFEEPVVVFSPELSSMDIGEIVYSKSNPESVGNSASVLSLINLDSPVPQLESGDKVSVSFAPGWFPIQFISDDSEKSKGIYFEKEPSKWFQDDGAVFYPSWLEKIGGLLPVKWISMRGEIVAEEGSLLIVDASVPVHLKNNLVNEDGDKLKIGDWVEGRIGQVYFLERLRA